MKELSKTNVIKIKKKGYNFTNIFTIKILPGLT